MSRKLTSIALKEGYLERSARIAATKANSQKRKAKAGGKGPCRAPDKVAPGRKRTKPKAGKTVAARLANALKQDQKQWHNFVVREMKRRRLCDDFTYLAVNLLKDRANHRDVQRGNWLTLLIDELVALRNHLRLEGLYPPKHPDEDE